MTTTLQVTTYDIFRTAAEDIDANNTYLKVTTQPGSAGSLQLKTGVYGAISVTTTPTLVKVGATNLANRIVLTVGPTNGTVYLGFDTSVTSSNGTMLEQGSLITVSATSTLNVYLVTASGTVDVRITEASDQ